MVHYFISYACQIVDPKGKNGIVSPQVTDSLPWLQWVGTNWSLGREDPLEKGMATSSSILAWKIPWTEEPGWLQSMGSQRVRHK